MGRSGRSRHQKRARAQAQLHNLEAYAANPHSFVFTRGCAGQNLRQLTLDVRRVMEPLTASRLQVRKKNSLKDCVAVAGPLGVTHFLILSKTETSVYFKLMRLPGGPTLTFQVKKVNLNTIKRCLLIDYNPDSQELDFRHYSIKVVPVGASRGMKKLLQEKFPNMSRLQDISELLATGAGLSESEAEPDGDHNITELPQAIAGRGNMPAQQSAVRLTEIGPRMTLQLIKVQDGIGEGKVMFHSFVRKTEEELQAILEAKEKRLQLKAQRRAQQAQNVQRKQEQREAHREKSLEGMKKAQVGSSHEVTPRRASLGLSEEFDDLDYDDLEEDDLEDDDIEYFCQAVGEAPSEDLFPEAKQKQPAKCPGWKMRETDRGKGRFSDQKLTKDKPQGAQGRWGPKGVSWHRGRGRGRPRKRAA
ncbi:suppressor of SWI4 1 homolog isoform X2 [Aotus nancymaae]|uniref:suppressor of SWI4 1 homolog isoform X2 n=1 Tax=Aotus nancymaae TaxID=37293 RepID=UPI0030FE3E85